MTKKLAPRARRSLASLATLSLAMVLSGCGEAEEPVAEDVDVPEAVVNIGVALSSPGLASGSNPEETSGAEITLGQAIVAELDSTDPDAQLRWVPLRSSHNTVESMLNGDMEFMLGQLSDAQVNDQLAWVGPYAMVQPALLVRLGPEDNEDAATTLQPLEAITSADDLADAPVCVVSNSVAATVELPVDDVTTQQTVTECEVGMRSGRYDAIAADDLQLAGVLMDPTVGSDYELVSWAEIGDDEDLEIADELVETYQYWIGTAPEQCEALAEALRTVLAEETLLNAFSDWEETTGFQPSIATADEVTTKHCPS